VFNLQGSEIIVILLIALVVLGPERLPDAVRRFMQTYNELRKMGSGFQAEIKSAFDEPMREMRNTANMVRDAADPSKLMAEAEAEQRLRDDADAVVASDQVLASPIDAPPPSGNGHDPDPLPHHGIVDPGYDVVATPGSPPPLPPPLPSGRFDDAHESTPAPPPPPPPPGRAADAPGPSMGLTGPSEPVAP
jgi:sec-independent protein translocase protein TatB